jgi:cholesterol oxidase
MNKEHFDAVVIGSGFGGSVMAYRLCKANLSVCVLERGKEYPPGEFPRSPHRMKYNFWDPSEGLHGLYNLWSFEKMGAIVSSGLGGGSLIFANVMIRKDEKWFVEEDPDTGERWHWPVQYHELEPHYIEVEQMLGVQKYPFDRAPYKGTPKTKEFEAAAKRLGLDWRLPNLAVTFANKGDDPVPGEPIREEHRNLHNRTRYTCRLVGECDFGCNFGSKNSLDYNYLSEAKRLGAEIRTLCEVKEFEPLAGRRGYSVHCLQRDLDRDSEQRITITADRLILAAGTFGSTYLLMKMKNLKNRGVFAGISRQLGTRFSGNGDLLTFALRCRKRDASGNLAPRRIDAEHGPVITSTIRIPDKEDNDGGEGRGFYLQEAGYPEFISWILQVFDTPGAVRDSWRTIAGRFVRRWLNEELDTDVGAEASRLFGECELSADLLPLLGMGRDTPDGVMKLRGEKLDLDWRLGNSKPYFDAVREKSREIAGSLGADRFVNFPALYFVTVHPLGGCPMGRNPQEGVVDSYGKVFGYEDLWIADGSVMPGPVGPNPSLTIAALADRFASRIVN